MTLIAIRASVTYLLVAVLAACDVNVPLSAVPGGVLGAQPGNGSGAPPGPTTNVCSSPPAGNAREILHGLGSPGRLVADDSYLYWVNRTNQYTASGTVMRVAKGGGAPQMLAALRDVDIASEGIAIDREAVYWIDRGTERGQDQLMRFAKTGGKLTTLAASLDADGALALDDQYVYLSDTQIAGAHQQTFVKRIPKLGGAPEIVAQLTDDDILFIATDDYQVYFTSMVSGSVHAVAKTGGETTAFAHTCGPVSVAAADGYVYWTDCGGLSEASRASDPPVMLVPGSYGVFDFSIASTRIYFSVIGGFNGPGGIYWIERDGGGIHMLAGNSCGYFGIAVDYANVYFTNAITGTVNVVAR